MRKSLKVASLIAATLGLVTLGAGPAAAAGNNQLPSSSAGATMYVSSTLRHITTSNDHVSVTLGSEPSVLQWAIRNASTGVQLGGTVNVGKSGTVTIVSAGIPNPYQFNNAYRATAATGSFTGVEYY
jgi:hypothetical protein